jgi:hypothetical protein
LPYISTIVTGSGFSVMVVYIYELGHWYATGIRFRVSFGSEITLTTLVGSFTNCKSARVQKNLLIKKPSWLGTDGRT